MYRVSLKIEQLLIGFPSCFWQLVSKKKFWPSLFKTKQDQVMSMGKSSPTAFNFGYDFWAKNGLLIIEMFLTPISSIATISLLIWINTNFHHQFQLTAGQCSTTAACKNLNGWSHSGQCCDFKHTAYLSTWLRKVEVDVQNTVVRICEEILDQSPFWKFLCLQLFVPEDAFNNPLNISF